MPKLKFLSLSTNPDVRDEDLAHLKDSKLKVLCLSCPNVTGESLKYIGQIETLTELILGGTFSFIQQVTDDHLKHLSGLVNLRRLTLRGTEVTAKGLKNLEPLKSLKKLLLPSGMPATAETKALKKAIPGLSIKDRL